MSFSINKVLIYTIIFFLLAVFLSLTVLTFNSDLRRNLMYKAIGFVNLYNYIIIRGDINNRDFESASEKILRYINLSQKISKGKNRMLQGIYDITELTSSKTYTQKEFNQMEKVYVEIDKITQDIYMNHVWLARSLKDNNLEKSIFHLNKAINLMKSDESAYRELISIYFSNSADKNLINIYCDNYFKEHEGSLKSRNYKNFFNDNQKFSIILNDNFEKAYTKNLESLENFNNYEFFFEDVKNINKLSIVHNFFSGSKLSIRNIILENNLLNEIEFDNLNYNSNSNYILSSKNDQMVFLSTNNQDQILNFYLNKEYENISKISLVLSLKKLGLANSSICTEFHEN